MDQQDAYYGNVRPEMARFIDGKPAHILEVGCAYGGFRENITWPCEYWGVEPMEDAAEKAAEKLSRVLTGTYESVAENLPDAYFDLVICNDVIEHMIDPTSFLKAVQKK